MAVQQKKYNALKLKLSQFLLKRSLKESSRKGQVCSLANAKTIGVSFAVNSMQELSVVNNVLKKIAQSGCQVFSLGYIPMKKPDDFYLSQKGISFFSDKDLDWLLRPTSDMALEFVQKDFDILIDLGSDVYYPMHYLLSNSLSKFKIGWLGENKPFDLMMDIEKEKGIEYFCDQVLNYLSKFNK